MINLDIIMILLEKINTDLKGFYDYVNSNIRKDINIRENLDFLVEENLINKDMKYSISGEVMYINRLHLTSKGIKILNEIKNGKIKKLEDLYDFDNINISVENNPNINVSSTFNNTNNISNENNNIINIKDLIDLVTFVNTNSDIDNYTKQDIINTIKEIEKAKNGKDFKSYVDLYSKLLTSLQATLNISPFIIQGFEWLKNLL